MSTEEAADFRVALRRQFVIRREEAATPLRVQEAVILKVVFFEDDTHLTPTITRPMLEILEEQIRTCQEAGANKYIGRFTRANFLESLQEFGVVRPEKKPHGIK